MSCQSSNSRLVGWRCVAVVGIPLLAGSLFLGGCGNDQAVPANMPGQTSVGQTSAGQTGDAAQGAGALTISDQWVKAQKKEMTGVLGTLTNTGDEDLTITGGSSDVAAMVELHETVSGEDGESRMQQKEGGFVLKAGESHELKPGGDHIMLMKITAGEVKAGDLVKVTLITDAGQELSFEAEAREFDGGNETYHTH